MVELIPTSFVHPTSSVLPSCGAGNPKTQYGGPRSQVVTVETGFIKHMLITVSVWVFVLLGIEAMKAYRANPSFRYDLTTSFAIGQIDLYNYIA